MIDSNRRLNKKVCFISGAPHSGSTLLGFILGGHSKCFYGGEMNKVRFLNIEEKHEDKYCKLCGRACPIWSQISLKKKTDIYEQLSLITHKPIIIDSTKKVEWLENQYQNLLSKDLQLFLIYLMRDGRAVINSRLRKYANKELNEIINEWIDHINLTNQFYDKFEGKKIKIHYEALATHSTEIIEMLCDFLEISYETTMNNYYFNEYHPLGGNIGTQSIVIKAQHKQKNHEIIKLSERNEYYYADHPLEIKLDQRWKSELPKQILSIFEEKTGQLNKEFIWKEDI